MHETHFPHSTAIALAAYDEEARELTVGLTTGRTYVYRDVEDWIYDGLATAESAGQYYNIRIKDRYPYSEVLAPEGSSARPGPSAANRPSPRRANPSRGSRARRLQSSKARRG